jgi:predicted DNA-binding ribbon-helix-helix protein
MKKKYSKKQLEQLEKDMSNPKAWEAADHTVSYKGPTSIRFSDELLKKLHAIATIRQIPISRLVNEYVKAFVESDYAVLEGMR